MAGRIRNQGEELYKSMCARSGCSIVMEEENKLVKEISFSFQALEEWCHVRVIQMSSTALVWVGKEPTFSNLVVSMPTKYDKVPTAVQILGEKGNLFQTSLSQRLGRKLGKQIYLSYNVEDEPILNAAIEKQLIEHLLKLS